jgi:predicted RNA binding protein YcfA (HicA-like mRNA interferase family)
MNTLRDPNRKPTHPKKDLGTGLVQKILKQAGLK